MIDALSLCLVLGLLGQSEGDTSKDARLKSMRDLAEAVILVEAVPGTRAQLIAGPIVRFDDPARSFSDGTIWAFGRSGRPAALFCLSLEKDSQGRLKWIHELTSIASGPVAASSRHASGPWTWNPKQAGIVMQPLAKAPVPAEDEARRLRQMREAARRFKAHESLDPARDDPADRFELRLLPQPVHRYADPASGLIDGAIFLLSYGLNPEIAVLIEARREGTADPSWTYGLARVSAARLRVSIDDREVADLPKPVDAGRTSPYYLFDRPALGLKD
jgi:hypothetical protein